MTISKEYGRYRVTCDVCDDSLGDGETFDTFEDAVASMREAGWKSRRALDGEWENICVACQ